MLLQRLEKSSYDIRRKTITDVCVC